MKKLEIKRMPSRSECDAVLGDTCLSNKIAKTGGFYKWADDLGLDVKTSETKIGIKYEKEICKKISEKYFAELTPVKFPYDILVEKSVKVDVKFSNLYTHSNGRFYTCNLEYKFPKMDILIFVCEDVKTLIIPAHELYGIKQLSIGKISRYDKYIDRWDILENFVNFYKTYK